MWTVILSDFFDLSRELDWFQNVEDVTTGIDYL